MSVNFFASVMVLPEQEDTVEVDINEKNLLRDTYRASVERLRELERKKDKKKSL
jgi:protein subunit release factor A